MDERSNNVALILYGKDDLRLENRPIPSLKPNEVLLKMAAVGICGSDVHFWVNGRIGRYVVEEPMVIGHEGAGTVVDLGSDVKDLKIGDRVAIEPGVPCKTCNYCKRGNYNECGDIVFCATPPDDGLLTKFYKQSADFVYKLPENVSLVEGALLEPLSVAVHACKRGNVTADSKVIIFGAGPIGLVTLLTAKAFGATKVMLIDVIDFRLEKAKEFGADVIYKIRKEADETTTANEISKAFDGEVNVIIDCSGVEASLRLAVTVIGKNGVLVLVGLGKPSMDLLVHEILFKEIDIRGCFRYCNDYLTALNLVAAKKVNVLPLVTHSFSMKDSLKAFQVAKTESVSALKVLIVVDEVAVDKINV